MPNEDKRQSLLGMITIGQSPRTDMVPEMASWLGPARPLERGALDGMRAEEIAALKPTSGDYALVSKLRDGSSATIAKRHILPRIQTAITELEEEGVVAVVLLCTGEFPLFDHERPLLTADRLLVNGVRAIAQGRRVGVLCPLPEQERLTRDKWTTLSDDLHIAPASPYGADLADLRPSAHETKTARVEYVVLDCMGYTQEMKTFVKREVGVPAILARSVVARLAAEVLW
jgi:protein AroM